jgi:hypothetical protein
MSLLWHCDTRARTSHPHTDSLKPWSGKQFKTRSNNQNSPPPRAVHSHCIWPRVGLVIEEQWLLLWRQHPSNRVLVPVAGLLARQLASVPFSGLTNSNDVCGTRVNCT